KTRQESRDQSPSGRFPEPSWRTVSPRTIGNGNRAEDGHRDVTGGPTVDARTGGGAFAVSAVVHRGAGPRPRWITARPGARRVADLRIQLGERQDGPIAGRSYGASQEAEAHVSLVTRRIGPGIRLDEPAPGVAGPAGRQRRSVHGTTVPGIVRLGAW